MSNLNGRLARIEQQLGQLPDPTNREIAAQLTALQEQLLQMTKEERLVWLDAQLAELTPGDSTDDTWREFLSDWKEFLTLKGQNTAARWDDSRAGFVHTELSRRWHELHQRQGWESWTGEGLPPQLGEIIDDEQYF